MTTQPLRLVIFGATGGTGRHLVTLALDAGHDVTVFVRSPEKLGELAARVRVLTGDVTDEAAVTAAIADQDVVISAIGAPPSSKDRVRERGTRTIVRAMEATGVRRLVSLSTHGIRETADGLPLLMKWLVVPLYLKGVFTDHEHQEAVVRDSSLDWTLVRPTHLTNKAPTGTVRHGFEPHDRDIAMKITRGDVARFMVEQATSEAYVRQAPTICN